MSTTPLSQLPRTPETTGRDTSTRTAVKVALVVLTLLLVAWVALSLVTLLARDTAHRSATYDGVRSVDLDLEFESVTITGSPTTGTVRMDRSFSWSLQRPTTSARLEGDRLVLTSNCHWSVGLGCRGDVRLSVPEGTAVRVHGSDGHVSVRGVTNGVEVATSDGGIDVGEVTGEVSLRTSDGRIELAGVTGPMVLRTSDGSITGTDLRSATVDAHTSDGGVRLSFLAAPDTVTASTSDGSVEVAVPRDQGAWDVDATTGDGRRTVDVATDPSAGRHIDVHTSDGSVLVRYGP